MTDRPRVVRIGTLAPGTRFAFAGSADIKGVVDDVGPDGVQVLLDIGGAVVQSSGSRPSRRRREAWHEATRVIVLAP